MAKKFVLAERVHLSAGSQPAAGSAHGVAALLREVGKASISPVIAIVFTVFAASSVAALAAVASVEMSSSDYLPVTARSAAHIPAPQVLGESVKGGPVVVYNQANLKLAVSPEKFDTESGKWSYKISWSRMADKAGSILLDKKVVVEDASSTGSFVTGFVLEPKSKHQITYFSKQNGKGVKIVNRRTFVVMPAQAAAAKDDVDQEDPTPEILVGVPPKASSTEPRLASGSPESVMVPPMLPPH